MQQTAQFKHVSSSDVSPITMAGAVDTEPTMSFSAFATGAKPPAFQETKNSSRSACADLQAASQSLSEVLKQVDAVLSQSAASPMAAGAQAALPSPSLRRVSVSNIVSTFEQNKVSPPIMIPTRENKRSSYPPPSQREAEPCAGTPLQPPNPQTEAVQHTSPQSDWTIVNSPTHTVTVLSNSSAEDAATFASIAQHESPGILQSPLEPAVMDAACSTVCKQQAAANAPPSNQQILHETISNRSPSKVSPVFEQFVHECAPVANAMPSSTNAAVATALTQHEPAVLAQLSVVAQSHTAAVAIPAVTAAPPPVGARYTFEDVERITTFAKEELQRRADAEVAALTVQLAAKTSQAQTLCEENIVLKETLLQ